MNSLNLYYSYIKSPYATPLSNNSPRFILVVENSVQIQKATIVILEINIFVYIPIIRYISKEKTYERTINNARSPPIYELLFSVLLDMQNGVTL